MASKTHKRLGVVAGAMMAMCAGNASRAEIIHQYTFADGAKDSVGKVDGVLKGDAKIADGKLTLENGEKASGDADIAYVEFAEPILPKQGSASIVVRFTAKESGQFARLIDIGGKDGTEGQAFIYLTPRTGDDQSRAAITASDAASKSPIDGERLDDAKPHVAAMVIDGAAKKLHFYVDGKEQGTANDLGDNTLEKVKQDHRWIGRSAFDADTALSATIDEVTVYDDALSAEKAASLTKPEGGMPMTGVTPPSTAPSTAP